MKLLMACLLAVTCALLTDGCASSNVNPAVARRETGYVDFYVTSTNDLYWDVTDMASNKKVFSQFSPLGDTVLRLAFKPGEYQFQVTFLNRVIDAPGTAEVDVRDGMVTPVLVTLQPMNSAVAQNKTVYFGRLGRRSKTDQTQTFNFKIIAEPQPPVSYRPKERMPYFQPAAE